MAKKHVIFGSAGTGKTTKIMEIIQSKLLTYEPEDIAVITYSKAGASEIRERLKVGVKEYPTLGRTLHSLYFQYYHLKKEDSIIMPSEIKAFCDKRNLAFTLSSDEIDTDPELSDPAPGTGIGNLMLSAFQKAEQTHYNNPIDGLPSNIESYDGDELPKSLMAKYYKEYQTYKTALNKTDHTGYLLRAYKEGAGFNFRCVIVDEFQDLSPLQYQLYLKIIENASEVYIAGDDDQAIYTFMGCSPKFLLDEARSPGATLEVLPISYRCPEEILAVGWKILSKLKGERQPKIVTSGAGRTGTVKILEAYDLSTLTTFFKGETALLTHTNKQRRKLEEELKGLLIPYTIWGRGEKSPYTPKFAFITNGLIQLKQERKINRRLAYEVASETEDILIRGNKTKIEDALKKEPFEKLNADISFAEFLSWFKMDVQENDDSETLAHIIRNMKYLRNKSLFWEHFNQSKRIGSPQVYVGTFHQSKGRGKDTIFVFNNISRPADENIYEDPEAYDAMVRAFFVAVTRSKHHLYIIENFFDMNYTFCPYI